MSLSNSTFLITGIFLLGSGTWVYLRYRKQKSPMLYYFAFSLISMALASTVWGIGSITSVNNSTIARLSYPGGILFGGIGIVYFTRVGLSMTLPRYEALLGRFFTLGSIAFAAGIYMLGEFDVIQTESGLTLWQVPTYVAGSVIGIGIVFTIINVALFTKQALTVSKPILKIRAILISFSFMLYMGGGLTHNIAQVDTHVIFSDLTTTLGAALVLFAILLPQLVEHEKPTPVDNKPTSTDEAIE